MPNQVKTGALKCCPFPFRMRAIQQVPRLTVGREKLLRKTDSIFNAELHLKAGENVYKADGMLLGWRWGEV